jgi:hypothetical protein
MLSSTDRQSDGLGIRSGTCTKKGTIPGKVSPSSQMKIYGIDFTSRPSRRKPLTCLECSLEGSGLRADELIQWTTFEAFETALVLPGPWIAGIDFPFGLPRKFIENIGWPLTWTGYVEHARTLGRRGFRDALDTYRSTRLAGDKEHRRATDIAAGSISPQKLYCNLMVKHNSLKFR